MSSTTTTTANKVSIKKGIEKKIETDFQQDKIGITANLVMEQPQKIDLPFQETSMSNTETMSAIIETNTTAKKQTKKNKAQKIDLDLQEEDMNKTEQVIIMNTQPAIKTTIKKPTAKKIVVEGGLQALVEKEVVIDEDPDLIELREAERKAEEAKKRLALKAKAKEFEDFKKNPDAEIASYIDRQVEKLAKFATDNGIEEWIVNLGLTGDFQAYLNSHEPSKEQLVKKIFENKSKPTKTEKKVVVKDDGTTAETKVYNKPDSRKDYTKKYFKDGLVFKGVIMKKEFGIQYRRATDDFVDTETGEVYSTITKASQVQSAKAGKNNYAKPWATYKAVVGETLYDIERLDINPVPEIAP